MQFILFRAQVSKRKTKASGSNSPESDICSPEGKKLCSSPRSEQDIVSPVSFDEEDQALPALKMTERIYSQLGMILERLVSVETKIQKIDEFFEKFSALETTIKSMKMKVNTLSDKSNTMKEKVDETKKGMEFANAEIEDLKKKDQENEKKIIKEIEDKLMYQEVYNRRENLCFFEIPEASQGAEDTFQVTCTDFSVKR